MMIIMIRIMIIMVMMMMVMTMMMTSILIQVTLCCWANILSSTIAPGTERKLPSAEKKHNI